MANTFKSYASSGVGTTAVSVYTVPASTTSTIIGLSIANTVGASTTISVSVMLRKGATDYYLIKNAPILPGDTLVVVGGDQKVVAQTTDVIKVSSDVAASCDAVISVLELT